MKYLLDTNVIIDWIRGDQVVISKITKRSQRDFALSNITIAELWYGIHSSKTSLERLSRQLAVASVVSTFQIIDFNQGAEEKYGEVISNLRLISKYKKKDCLDYQIASVAILHNLTLVTRNLNDFKYISNLSITSI